MWTLFKRPLDHGLPQTVFSGEGQNFLEGGQKLTNCLKNTKKDTIFSKKAIKQTYTLKCWILVDTEEKRMF